MNAKLFSQVKTVYGLQTLFDWQFEQYEDMQESESDRMIAICGYEGSGKSYLALHLFEHWWRKVLKSTLEDKELIKFFATNDVEWVKSFAKCGDIPYLMLAHDEAVNIIYSKDATSKQSKAINKAFKKTRGLRVYHVELIPQPQRIDKELRQDRLRTLYYVFKHGDKRYVAVYPKKKLEKVLAELDRLVSSQAKDVQTTPSILNCETLPSLLCEIPPYQGSLLELYRKKKQINMVDSVKELESIIVEKNDKKKMKEVRDMSIIANVKAGTPKLKVAKMHNVTEKTVYNKLNKLQYSLV